MDQGIVNPFKTNISYSTVVRSSCIFYNKVKVFMVIYESSISEESFFPGVLVGCPKVWELAQFCMDLFQNIAGCLYNRRFL